MRTITAAFSLIVLAIAFSPVQAGELSASESATELSTLTTQWMDAMLRQDKPTLERLMAPDYVLHTPDPKHPETDRATWLDNLFNNMKIDRWEQTEISGHSYGAVGVVTSTYSWAGTFHGQAFDSKGHCTDVWRRARSSWHVVSRTCMAFPGSVTLGSAPQK